MRRGKERWTQADDKRLGRALLEVFSNQGRGVVLSDSRALWKRVQHRYQGLMAAEQEITPDIAAAQRSTRSLHTRWARGILPELVLFASLVDKMQKAGKKPTEAIKQAGKLFRSRRNEINAAAVRQFVQERQQAPTISSDSEMESARPKLKFESFHFRHCYDILCSSPTFMEALLEQRRNNGGKEPQKKRRQSDQESGLKVNYSSSTPSDDSDAPDSYESEKQEAGQITPASRFQVGSMPKEHLPIWQKPQLTANGVKRTSYSTDAAVQRGYGSATLSFENDSDNVQPFRLECDRAVANQYVRLRMQSLREDRRLKLLAELRGVVTTISQLTQQLAWNGVASAALAVRTEGMCSALDQDVLRDITFFRHEKQRLKQAIAGLDGPVTSDTSFK